MLIDYCEMMFENKNKFITCFQSLSIKETKNSN